MKHNGSAAYRLLNCVANRSVAVNVQYVKSAQPWARMTSASLSHLKHPFMVIGRPKEVFWLLLNQDQRPHEQLLSLL